MEVAVQSCASLSTIDRVVANARARAQFAARLLRRLHPFRHDPRVAGVDDLCAVLTGDTLFRDETIAAIETLAGLLDKLLATMSAPRPHASREALETLYAALLDVVDAARALDSVLAGDVEIAPGGAG
jgi:hypothetical protein